jgi:hypothetical protein
MSHVVMFKFLRSLHRGDLPGVWKYIWLSLLKSVCHVVAIDPSGLSTAMASFGIDASAYDTVPTVEETAGNGNLKYTK